MASIGTVTELYILHFLCSWYSKVFEVIRTLVILLWMMLRSLQMANALLLDHVTLKIISARTAMIKMMISIGKEIVEAPTALELDRARIIHTEQKEKV